MLGGGHKPCARIIRHARLRPLLESGDQSVLRQIFGHADVADDARKTGDQGGDSIRQTASIARCTSVAATATDHIIFNPTAQGRTTSPNVRQAQRLPGAPRLRLLVRLVWLA